MFRLGIDVIIGICKVNPPLAKAEKPSEVKKKEILYPPVLPKKQPKLMVSRDFAATSQLIANTVRDNYGAIRFNSSERSIHGPLYATKHPFGDFDNSDEISALYP
jgi:hypothetical protein